MTRIHASRFAAAAFVLAMWTVPAAQQRSPQQQRSPEEYANFLEAPERVARLQIPRIIETLGVKSGVRVADVGAGSGLLTRPIAAKAAPATVFAVDIDSPLLKVLEQRAAAAGLKNIRIVVGAPDDPRIPEPVDVILICDALHHVEHRAAFVKTTRGYLAPGGRLAIIDYRQNWPEGHESMQFSAADLEGWTKGAGLTREASFDWIQDSFFNIYR